MFEGLASLSLLLALSTAPVEPSSTAPPPPEDEKVVVVQMVEKSATTYAFEPADIRATPGTVVRFVQSGAVPHNVEFKELPDGAELGDARMGPFLLQKGESYEVRIDDRFVPGTYDFVCTPHVVMGMKGSLTVVEAPVPNP